MLEKHRRKAELEQIVQLTPEQAAELEEIKTWLQKMQDEKDASFRRRASQCGPGESPVVFSSE